MQSLGTANHFSVIDLASGYWQIPIEESSKKYVALICRAGFSIQRNAFRLKERAPAVFQTLMTEVLGPLLWKCATNYMDDIIVFSPNRHQHLQDIRNVLQRLEKAKLSIKLSKCFFFQPKVKFLGFIVSKEGITANPEKIKPIVEMPPPTDKKGIDSS